MKKAIPLLFALCISLPAFAAPATDDAVDKLIAVSGIKTETDMAVADIDDMINTTVRPTLHLDKMSPENRASAEALIKTYSDSLKEEFSWDAMKGEYARIYKETFTEEEVRALIAMYDTPAGKILQSKHSVVAAKTSYVNKAKFAKVMAKMQATIADLGTKVRAKIEEQAKQQQK